MHVDGTDARVASIAQAIGELHSHPGRKTVVYCAPLNALLEYSQKD
jgi:hypothetical protein